MRVWAVQMIKLLCQKYAYFEYAAICANCGRTYHIKTWQVEGAADYVNVFCDNCETIIGRVRHDMGGDFHGMLEMSAA